MGTLRQNAGGALPPRPAQCPSSPDKPRQPAEIFSPTLPPCPSPPPPRCQVLLPKAPSWGVGAVIPKHPPPPLPTPLGCPEDFLKGVCIYCHLCMLIWLQSMCF